MNSKILLLVFAMAFFLFACGKEVSDFEASDEAFRVLVLTIGSYNDQSINQRCYEAFQSLGHKLQIAVHFKSGVSPNDVEDLVNGVNEKKYDFVFGLDSQLFDSLNRTAAKNPHHKFAIIGSFPGNNENLGTLTYQPSHHYLVGVLAALKSKSGKIGVLNRADSPQSIEENTAFNDGLRAVKADILVTNVTFDSSNSKKIVSNYADVFRKSGVDLIFNNCGPMGLDVYKWAASNNIMMIGSVDDQYYLAPSIVLTSVQINYEKMLGFALEQMMRGQWQGSLYRFGMAEKVTDIAPLRGILNASQEEVFYEIYKEIASQKGEVFERI